MRKEPQPKKDTSLPQHACTLFVRYPLVRPQFSAVKIATNSHALALRSNVLSRDSAGSHLRAGMVIWQRTAPMRNHDRNYRGKEESKGAMTSGV